MTKDGAIKIINNRIEEFVKIHHHFEADELRKACSSIKRLMPPSNFQSEHNDGKITMKDLMLYYSTSEGHDFNTPVIEVINDLKQSKRVGG